MMILLMLKSSCLGRPWHPPWLFRQGETPADPSGFRDPSEEKTQQLRQELERTQQIRCTDDLGSIFWVWVNTYRYIFSGMNIHLPAILMFTRGTRFWHTAILLGSYDRIYSSYMLVGGFKHDWIMFYFIYGIVIPTPLTNSYFSRWFKTTNQLYVLPVYCT